MTDTTPAPVPTPARDYSALYTPAAIVIAGIIIAIGLVTAFGNKGSSAPDTAKAPTVKVNVKDVSITDSDPYIGQKDAKVTLVVWSDYQCPFCKAVEVGHPQIPTPPAFPTLIKDYVDTGKVRIVFKDYPFLGEDSYTGAIYEHAIWKLFPSKFYEWRLAMYTAQDEEGDKGFGDEASIVALTKKIAGINVAAVQADVKANGDAYKKLADADRAEGSKYGINGTPGFVTGTTLIPGAVGIADFKAAIDPQL